jgi:hypothetical protein
MTMLMKYVEGANVSEEENEWAAEKFFELRGVAYGTTEPFSDEPVAD